MNAFSTDNLQVFKLNKDKDKGLRDFNYSLIPNTSFVKQMKQIIEHIKQQQLSQSDKTDQIKLELFKDEIRKFVITYSKKISQNTKRVNVN